MLSRRDFTRIALAGLPVSAALARINSTIHGVQVGTQTYSFRDLPLDGAIKAMVDIGLGDCELFAPGHVEPRLQREELRKWRETVSLDHFKGVRKKSRQRHEERKLARQARQAARRARMAARAKRFGKDPED